jgi:hypothetical protein
MSLQFMLYKLAIPLAYPSGEGGGLLLAQVDYYLPSPRLEEKEEGDGSVWVTFYVGLPVLPALLCLHTTVLRQGVLQCSQTP